MDSKWKIVALFCLVFIGLNSCTLQRSAVETSRPLNNKTISPADSLQPAATQTPMISPTMSFSSTLSAPDAEAKLLELLYDDIDCRLPCFFGILPGQTIESQAIAFLHQFDEISSGTEIRLPQDKSIVSLDVITQDGYSKDYPEIVKWTEVNMMVYNESGSSIQKIYQSPHYNKYFRNYTLPLLLSTYGAPEHAYIFLDAGIADMGLGIDLYLLHLDYSKQGWVAHLEMPLLVRDDLFVGCPVEAFTKLRLWSPTNPARDYELDSKVLFTVEEATGLTLDEFYKKFKDPENTSCLETPTDIHK